MVWLTTHSTPSFIKRHGLNGKMKNVLDRCSKDHLINAYNNFFTPILSLKELAARRIIRKLGTWTPTLLTSMPTVIFSLFLFRFRYMPYPVDALAISYDLSHIMWSSINRLLSPSSLSLIFSISALFSDG